MSRDKYARHEQDFLGGRLARKFLFSSRVWRDEEPCLVEPRRWRGINPSTSSLAADGWVAGECATIAEHDMPEGWDPATQDQLTETVRACMREVFDKIEIPLWGSAEEMTVHLGATRSS